MVLLARPVVTCLQSHAADDDGRQIVADSCIHFPAVVICDMQTAFAQYWCYTTAKCCKLQTLYSFDHCLTQVLSEVLQ